MQPGTDQFGQPAQPVPQPQVIGQPVQPQYGQPPQQQVVGQPATIVGLPAVGTGVPLEQQMIVGEAQSTNAMIGLVLGILGIIGSFFYGIGCLCGVIGLIITYGAKKITDLNPMHPDKGTVKAALITNWIAVILAVLMLVTVVLAGVLYVWANNLAEPVDEDYNENNATTLNTYTAEDAADAASAAGDGADTLIKMQMTGKDDLAWSFVKITLSVGDNVYTCSVASGDDCIISQQAGDNDNAWEPGEYIFLSEGTEEICSVQGCAVDISVTNNGNTVAGDGAAVVN